MTVAAVLIVPDLEMALADAHGEPAIRRAAQAAWAGGAMPLVVVAPPQADETPIADLLADLPVTVRRPGPDTPHGVGRFLLGFDVAAGTVAETAAALLWPARYAWVDPETITSLVEAYGATPGSLVRPAFRGEPGYPALVPAAAREGLADAGGGADEAIGRLITAGFPTRVLDVGDPGVVHDVRTAWADLPAFHGPEQPAGDRAESGPIEP